MKTLFALNRTLNIFVVAAMLGAVTSPAFASTEGRKIVFENTGTVAFKAIGQPSALKVKGKGASLSGEIKINSEQLASGKLNVDLRTFRTGIKLRDRHMKEKYLEVSKHAIAELTIEPLKIPQDIFSSGKEMTIPFKGSLSLHGENKPVTGKVNLLGKKTLMNVKASFSIDLSTFKIEIPSYLGITIAKKVDITVEAEGKIVDKK